MQYIRWLTKNAEILKTKVGGKVANLSQLMSCGIHIPEGFCITTEGYYAYARDTGIEERLREILQSYDTDDPSKLAVCAQKCQGIILSEDIPQFLLKDIREAYHHLSQGRKLMVPVAVRSSASLEDLPHVSFAGQYKTILNVRNEKALFEGVKGCWASLWSERALYYRRHHRISETDIRMAVLVQEMVDSDISGIMFTANPVNGSENEIVINASFGLGEAIVSGKVSSDTYIVRKSDALLLQHKVASKRLKVIALEEGETLEVAVSPEQRDIPALEKQQITELLDAGRLVEERFGLPQDIEWSYSAGTLYLLQSRPITALRVEAGFPVVWTHPQDSTLPFCREDELAPTPLCPWEAHLFMMFVDSFNKARKNWHSIFRYRALVVNGYLYTTDIPLQLNEEEIATYRKAYEQTIVKLMEEVPEQWYKEWLPEIERDIKEWSQFDLKNASLGELIGHLQKVLSQHKHHEYLGAIAGVIWYPIVENLTKFLKELLGNDYEIDINTLLQGLKSKAYEVEETLWELTKKIKLESELSSIVLNNPPDLALKMIRGTGYWQLFEQFLTKSGHFGGDNLLTPSWKEKPTSLLSILSQRISQQGETPSERLQRLERKREIATNEVAKHLSGNQQQLNHFLKNLQRAQKALPIGQDRYIINVTQSYAILREILLEIGHHLVASSWIEEPQDIFFLMMDEVEEIINHKGGSFNWSEVIAHRRDELKYFEKVVPPRIIGSPPTQLPPNMKYQWDILYPEKEKILPEINEGLILSPQTRLAAVRESKLLRGEAGSPGRVKAQARVIHSIAESRQVTKGDILVCPITTPAWTPLFGIIGGLITDMGVMLSHPAVVAREYGIPAVVGTDIATKVVSNNQIVTVDGSSGYVHLETE
ncbi:MAG: PEP-utilizing enzyme [Candidatus Poribacteria bacterium]|nr:PEP-utilizing enzyme [Candidatus Poribacteria bacterium]